MDGTMTCLFASGEKDAIYLDRSIACLPPARVFLYTEVNNHMTLMTFAARDNSFVLLSLQSQLRFYIYAVKTLTYLCF